MKEKINKILSEYLSKEISYQTNDFLKYSYSLIQKYSQGGKRLRPIAMIMSFDSYNGKGNIIPIAIAMELYHTHTLILDDIMDEDEIRRNNPTVYKHLKEYYLKNFSDEKYNGSLFTQKSNRFAASIAIMLGNITNIFVRNLILSSDFSYDNKIESLFKFEKMNQEIHHGQILDIYYENKKITEREYLDMIYRKTAVLFGLCFELGTFFAGKDENTQHTMKTIGEKLAMSFQIQDDLLDITGKKGHEIGSDIKKNKKTLLMTKLLEKTEIKTNNIKEIIKMMHDTHVVDYCEKLSLQYTNESKELIKKLDVPTHFKEQFLRFSDLFHNSV